MLDACAAHDLRAAQFNMLCAGLEPMPDEIDPALCKQIRMEMAARGLTMASLSGTYNMIHPDPAERARGLRRLGVLAAACAALDTRVITLCTGTRDAEDMWRFHPDNATTAAWRDLVAEMEKALTIAEDHDITLAVEPELVNVMDSATSARRLLDEMQSSRLKIIIDGANLFPSGTLPRQHEIIAEAFALLGDDIAIAHAKDLVQDGRAGDRAAGTGKLDYPFYIEKLREFNFRGPLQMHGLLAEQVAQTAAFLRNLL